MRRARTLAPTLPALLLVACGGGAAEPPLVTPAPVPEPADETVEPDTAAPGPPAPEPSPEEKAALAAVARLTAEPPVAYYLPGDGTVLVARAEVEGAARASALLVQPDGASETIAIADEQGRRDLGARLAGKQLVELTYTAWPEGARKLELDRPRLKVSWQKSGKLEASAGKKKIPTGQMKATRAPAGLFASPDSPAVLIALHRQPGEAGVPAPAELLRFDLPASTR